MAKKDVLKIVKLLISLSLIIWIVEKGINTGVIGSLKTMNIWFFILGCIFHFLAFAILLVRWHLILGINHKNYILNLVPSYYIGIFSNNLLPGTVGGDFVRATYLYQSGIPLTELLLSSIVDRLVGIITTLLICLAALYYSSNDGIMEYVNLPLVIVILAMSVIMPIVIYLFFRPILQILSKIKISTKGLAQLNNLYRLFQLMLSRPFSIILSLLLSFMSTVCVILCYFYLAEATSIDININTLVIIVPISYFATSLPISVGGLGVRESTIIFLLSLFGIANSQGITISLLYLLVLIIVSIPGGLFLFTNSLEKDKKQ